MNTHKHSAQAELPYVLPLVPQTGAVARQLHHIGDVRDSRRSVGMWIGCSTRKQYPGVASSVPALYNVKRN